MCRASSRCANSASAASRDLPCKFVRRALPQGLVSAPLVVFPPPDLDDLPGRFSAFVDVRPVSGSVFRQLGRALSLLIFGRVRRLLILFSLFPLASELLQEFGGFFFAAILADYHKVSSLLWSQFAHDGRRIWPFIFGIGFHDSSLKSRRFCQS